MAWCASAGNLIGFISFCTPFVWGAVAINLFMLSLGWQAIGLFALSPYQAMIFALPFAVPATWLCLKWVRGLIAEAEK